MSYHREAGVEPSRAIGLTSGPSWRENQPRQLRSVPGDNPIHHLDQPDERRKAEEGGESPVPGFSQNKQRRPSRAQRSSIGGEYVHCAPARGEQLRRHRGRRDFLVGDDLESCRAIAPADPLDRAPAQTALPVPEQQVAAGNRHASIIPCRRNPLKDAAANACRTKTLFMRMRSVARLVVKSGLRAPDSGLRGCGLRAPCCN